MDATLIGVFAYVLVQFAIGVWVSRWVKTNTDFIIAGRTPGLGSVSFSVYATFFGAESIVATAGNVYAAGLPGSRIACLRACAVRRGGLTTLWHRRRRRSCHAGSFERDESP
jgi:Na+/proline symporter